MPSAIFQGKSADRESVIGAYDTIPALNGRTASRLTQIVTSRRAVRPGSADRAEAGQLMH